MPTLDRQRRDATNKALREWAAAEGIDLPTSGRIPPDVREQFEAAGSPGLSFDGPAGTDGDDDAAGDLPAPPSDIPPPPAPRAGTAGARGRAKQTTRSRRTVALEGLQSDLAGGISLLGAGTMYVSPITGRCMIEDADPVSVEIIRLGEQYPKFGKWLLEAAKVAPPLKLGRFGARWAVAVAVDRGRLTVDALVPTMLGVYDVAKDLADSGVIELTETPRTASAAAKTASAA